MLGCDFSMYARAFLFFFLIFLSSCSRELMVVSRSSESGEVYFSLYDLDGAAAKVNIKWFAVQEEQGGGDWRTIWSFEGGEGISRVTYGESRNGMVVTRIAEKLKAGVNYRVVISCLTRFSPAIYGYDEFSLEDGKVVRR
ncbi:hypothetical protein [Pseudomonas sp. zfem003]|uniref:hypothetical protein n=1 Tax=Pseudomonas sp. zfem003 TaxID=3078198 RepID=UPI00292A04A1|nr:hypothetical protein [Pseudomonas sp. zfem003]MDU9398708.1 hypothetical protein [Pseudomonas sp. zfem003]